MEGVAIYLIYLESVMLEDLIPYFSGADHPSTAEDVLHAAHLNVVKVFTGLAMQAEVELKTTKYWLFVDTHIFQL